MTKKKVAIMVSIVIAVIFLIVGVSYAYYSANVKEVNKTQTVIKTNELTIVYTGTEEINVNGIVPGDSFIKKFTVENTSNISVTYNVYLEDITNEFNEDLVYTLKDKDGTVIEQEVLSSTNTGKTYLITDIEIDSNELKEYEMTIEFKFSDKDQNKLQGKNFKATLGIDTDPIKVVKVVNEKIELDKLNNGDIVPKTFSVKNLSKETRSYDLKLSDVVSTYGDNLTYSLIKNGSEVISNETMPSSDTILLESQTINSNTTDEYEMTIEFDNETAALDYIIAAENDEFTANISVNNYDNNYIGTIYDFEQKNEGQKFLTPCEGEFKIELWGAQGGNDNTGTKIGGLGAYTSGEITLDANTELYFYVGEVGKDMSVSKKHGVYNFNGSSGGNYACYTHNNGTKSQNVYGGAATDVRIVNGEWDNFESLKSRIMVAAGGSAANIYQQASPAGGLNGYSGGHGTGATQTSAGGPNHGGFGYAGIPTYNAICDANSETGASSGYYGGGAANTTGRQQGLLAPGSGSSFISGHNGCNAISIDSTASNIIHTNQEIHYSGKTFTNTKMIDGKGYSWTNVVGNEVVGMPSYNGNVNVVGNEGNGHARITVLSCHK